MSYGDISDQEQVELIKSLWKEYGISVLIGILLAFLLSLGWRAYLNQRNLVRMEASTAYEQLLSAMYENDTAKIDRQANFIKTQFNHTPYAPLAAFLLAQQDVQQNKLDAAAGELKWVIKSTGMKSVRQIARLRLARVLKAEQKYAEALSILNTVDESAFMPEADLVKGDIFLAQKDPKAAAKQYQLALTGIPENDPLRELIKVKLDDLAIS